MDPALEAGSEVLDTDSLGDGEVFRPEILLRFLAAASQVHLQSLTWEEVSCLGAVRLVDQAK
jgi:hypothetical protein